MKIRVEKNSNVNRLTRDVKIEALRVEELYVYKKKIQDQSHSFSLPHTQTLAIPPTLGEFIW